MDASRFDALVRTLSTAGSRRDLLRFLSALPIVGGLAALLGDEEGAAKGQRKRRKKPHHHRKHTGNRAGKQKKRRCKPESKAKTCEGTCGSIRNNCKKTVDCGSCACASPCPICQTCQEAPGVPGVCVPDPAMLGDACGVCRTCNAAGECAIVADDTPCDDDDACTQVDTCQAGICIGGAPVVCQPLDQCHTAGVCDPDTGQCSNPEQPDGTACDDGDACTQTDTCQSGVCSGSNPVVCNSPNECQTGPGACDAGSGQCTYPAKADGTRCGNKCLQACTNGMCGAGEAVVCGSCQLPDTCNPTSGECDADPAKRHTCDGPCPSGEWCDAGACADIQDTVTIPDCHSLCNGSTDVCGQTVSCPSCDLCRSQTGCFSNELPDGPVGPGRYCSFSGPFGDCTTNADCDRGDYCASQSAPPNVCARICPF